jgi:RNA polymerase sigma factor (sigma-70 family)
MRRNPTKLTRSQQKLIEDNIGIIRWAAKVLHKRHPDIDMSDIFSACNEGIVTAARGFDPSKAAFITYAFKRIRATLRRDLLNSNFIRVPVHLHDGTARKIKDKELLEFAAASKRAKKFDLNLDYFPCKDAGPLEEAEKNDRIAQARKISCRVLRKVDDQMKFRERHGWRDSLENPPRYSDAIRGMVMLGQSVQEWANRWSCPTRQTALRFRDRAIEALHAVASGEAVSELS